MPNKGMTLLIVEDNHDLRNGLRDILAYEGFTVLTASQGKEALEQMRAITPDLIISDITMPEMDGYAFYDAVRSHPSGVTIPFIFLTARGEREDVMRGRNLGVEDYLIKPVSRNELVAAVQARLTRFRQLQFAQLEQAYQAALTALANGIEVRDRYTRGHVERVTAYSLAMGDQLGWTGSNLEALRFGAILHDIGKIFVNSSILTKPGKLNKEEGFEMVLHPINGAEMIKDIPYLAPAIPIIRYHHERWNGSGYPEGRIGDEIPIEARIVAIADSFDAMTTDRPYHHACTLQEAHDEIINTSGILYDPMIVGTFQKTWDLNRPQEIYTRWRATEDTPPA